MNDAARRDMRCNRNQRSIFRSKNERQRSSAALAHDNHDAALAGLVFGKTAVNAVGTAIGGAHMAAKICTVHLDSTGRGGTKPRPMQATMADFRLSVGHKRTKKVKN